MNKRSLLPVLSTALLAPAFLAGQVYAEEATTSAESSAVVATPATSATPAPVESPLQYRKLRQLQKRLHLQKLRQLLLNLLKAKKRTPLSYTPMMSMVVL